MFLSSFAKQTLADLKCIALLFEVSTGHKSKNVVNDNCRSLLNKIQDLGDLESSGNDLNNKLNNLVWLEKYLLFVHYKARATESDASLMRFLEYDFYKEMVFKAMEQPCLTAHARNEWIAKFSLVKEEGCSSPFERRVDQTTRLVILHHLQMQSTNECVTVFDLVV
eukprot:Selendium_serpulae@DN8029_c0_g1_i1.p1